MIDKTVSSLEELSKKLTYYKDLKERFEHRLMERVISFIDSLPLDKILETLRNLHPEKWSGHIDQNSSYDTNIFEPTHIELGPPNVWNKFHYLKISVDYSISSGEYGDECLVYEKKFENELIRSLYEDIHTKVQEHFKRKGITEGHHDGGWRRENGSYI